MRQSSSELAAAENWASFVAGRPEFASAGDLLTQFYAGEVTRFGGLGGDRYEACDKGEQEDLPHLPAHGRSRCLLCKQAWSGVRTVFVVLVKARRANGTVALVAADEDLLALPHALST